MNPISPLPIAALFCGVLAPLGENADASGIAKRPVPGPWVITPTGIEGDFQGDRTHHGGPEKALHHYPFDHYNAWAEDMPAIFAGKAPPLFGENISTAGITELDVCIGDLFHLGNAILQISQGRQPCWRLGAHIGWNALPNRVQITGRTGWYYRVLRPGTVEAGDVLLLAERHQPAWSVKRVTRAMFDRHTDMAELMQIADLPQLTDKWRETCRQRAQSGTTEDSARRLTPSD